MMARVTQWEETGSCQGRDGLGTSRQSFELPHPRTRESSVMRLMARDRAEKEGRFGSGRPRVAPQGFAESGYGGLVLERLARHTCRIAGVDWSCLFVRDTRDPRLVIAAAGHGVPWDLIGTRIGSDVGAVGQVLSTGKPVVLADYRELVSPSVVEDEVARPGAAVPIRTGAAI